MISIVYESKTGHTLKYAQMLSQQLHIPYYSIKKAETKLNDHDKIIFLSWICAGKIKEKNNMDKKYHIICYGAVGAYPYSDNYLNELKTANKIDKPLFYLRGGIDYQKLSLPKKILIKIVGKTIKNPSEKTKEMFSKGYSFVSLENLEEIIKFMQIKHI